MVPFRNEIYKTISPAIMEEIYEKIKTPYKYGHVLKFYDEFCDSPSVFKYKGKWYMSFIKIFKDVNKSGYDSHLAESDDLLYFKYLFKTMARNNTDKWDSKQIALYAAFVDNDLFGSYKINKVNGYYHFAYLGGNLDGYETNPLMIGQCKTTDILNPYKYTRLGSPRLKPSDNDARIGEKSTLYKSNMFIDSAKTTGYPYVCAYNAASEDTHKESIFLAVSENGEEWMRYGDRPIITDDTPDGSTVIIADPQILKFGEIYIMLYYVSRGKTFNTFACSYDLVNWTKWHGAPLIESSEEWENIHAHKPCMVYDGKTLYHFYCAVNNKNERFIAVATNNKDLKKSK